MYQKAVRFLSRNKIKPTEILYIKHIDRKSQVCLKNGDVYDSYLPLKVLLDALPKGAFLNITRVLLYRRPRLKKSRATFILYRMAQYLQGACEVRESTRPTARISKSTRLPTPVFLPKLLSKGLPCLITRRLPPA